ncbi:MAG: alpha/beta fold hydrolase, partial [Balneolaceae bacterium]|nr:alpha/beta fold hydrolase [Balneolaceae bacterium]
MVKDTTVIADSEIRMAYRDIYRGSEKNPPVLLMLHGSPAGVSFFDPLIDDLAGDFRILAPDYPGYNGSERDLPDYSMRTFAVYIKHFMDSLDVGKVHLAGYSLGGGVAIYMSEYYPERVHSLVLISSLGVQELELLGSYRLNHMVHGAQLGLIWMLHEAVPHFGLLDDVLLNVPYARSFYDSDQRPLRGYLEEFRGPMLIQHGTEDGLVPVAAAKEHHRLVPQSRLQLYDGGHLILRSKSNMLAADIETFIRDVEAGEARTFAEADPRRKALARKPFRQVTFVEAEGITLFVIMIIIAFSTLISEDLTCITAGMLAARGLIGIWPAIIACFAGILIGDIGLYLAGRFLGRPAVSKVPFRWFISEEDLERSSKWFNAKGPAIILMSRFVPGTRLPTYFSAGVIGAGFWMFTFYFTLAAALWTPILVGLSMLVGSELLRYFEIYREYAFLVVIIAIFVLYLSFKFVFPLVTWKGRRMVLSRWRRLTRWEFWPPYVIYIPVCLYIIVLWWRHSRLTVFTAANPGIEDGGFIGESKSEIL